MIHPRHPVRRRAPDSTSKEATISVANGDYFAVGLQLRRRKCVPQWFGDFVLWVFFHRQDTKTKLTISGL